MKKLRKRLINYIDKAFHYCKLNVKVERSKEDIGPIFLWNLLQNRIYGQNKPQAILLYQHLMVGTYYTPVINARLVCLTLNPTLPLVLVSYHSVLQLAATCCTREEDTIINVRHYC